MIKSIDILKGVELRYYRSDEIIKNCKLLRITLETGFYYILDLKNNKNIIDNFDIIKIKKIITLYEDSILCSKWL